MTIREQPIVKFSQFRQESGLISLLIVQIDSENKECSG
jgi:hypothetical protein